MLSSYLHYRSFSKALAAGKDSCLHAVELFLSEIKKRENLNAFLEVFEKEALERAKIIDDKIHNGHAGRLAGMVIAIKDNICYAGHKVSAASKILKGFESIYSSTVVQRLLAEDAIIIGRTNCDEFAMGSSNENSAYGPVRNPLNENLVPGGSSGGSAAAVAAGFCHAALGSDTGGSIRQPASFTGTVGLRPTYGRISRHGLLAFASSFDQIGALTRSVYDTALLLEVMAGKDEYDSTVSTQPVGQYLTALAKDHNCKLAYLEDCIDGKGIDPEISRFHHRLIDSLQSDGVDCRPAEFPFLDYMIPLYYVLATAEASSNLSRYAGLLYGYRSPKAESVESIIIKSRSEGFGAEVKRRIMLGTYVLSEAYYEAYYDKAQRVRRVITEHLNNLLDENDFVILPTSPTTAFAIGAIENPISMYLSDIYTIQAAAAGLPAISLPLGIHSNGMPFGVQVMGRKFDEERLLSFSQTLMSKYKVETT